MHDARDAEDTRLLEAGEIKLLVEGYYGVIIERRDFFSMLIVDLEEDAAPSSNVRP